MMNLNPEPLKIGTRDTAKLLADPTVRAPKCVTCQNIKAFCECDGGFQNPGSGGTNEWEKDCG